MLAKFGFLIVVVIFGLLAFAVGTLAPDSIRTSVASASRMVIAKLPFFDAPNKTDTKDGAAEKSAGKDAPPIPMELLLLPTPLPDKAMYALQAGQFGSPDAADILGQRLKSAGLPFQVIAVVDRSGQPWSVVAAGQYASPDDARTARPVVAKEGGVTDVLPVILLPGQSGKS